MQSYIEAKHRDADEPDADGIPCPHPEGVGMQVQNLHRITQGGTNRFFICRQPECTPAGSFFGFNTDWISSETAGGWKFVCPACGTRYRPDLVSPWLIPANHIWHIEATGELMLAEWPSSLEERFINEMAVVQAERTAGVRFANLSREEVRLRIREVVASHRPRIGFATMQLSPGVIRTVEDLNAYRGKNLPYTWDHIKNGYTGGFYKYIPGETLVMKSDEVTIMVIMIVCRMREEARKRQRFLAHAGG